MSPPASSDRSLNNLLLGIAVTALLILGVPFIFGFLGWSSAPAGKSWWVLVAACVGMVVKLLASETASGEFEFYKFGYDNCVTTLGAVITAFAIQLSSPDDLFPGLASIQELPKFGKEDPATVRLIQLAVFFVLTLIVTWITAKICVSIKKNETSARSGKALGSAIVGPMFLAAYALLLASRS